MTTVFESDWECTRLKEQLAEAKVDVNNAHRSWCHCTSTKHKLQDELQDELAEAQAEIAVLRDAVFSAAETFSEYASIHRAKEVPDLRRAEFNQWRCDQMREALSRPSSGYLKEWLGEPVVFYECEGCGHMYMQQITSCDCMTRLPIKEISLYAPEGLK